MENLEWGLRMTVLGMGLVFALLGLLWGLLTLVLALDKNAREVVSPAAATAQAEPIAAVDGMAADLVAAIVVATLRHRLTLRRQAAPLMRRSWPGSKLFASRWVVAGRVRQNTPWQSRGK